MLNVNGNYHNRNTDPTCRACGNKTETQEHILEECPALILTKKSEFISSCSRPAVGSNIVQITRATFFVNVFS